MFEGYLQQDLSIKTSLIDGWYDTNDLVSFDDSGYYWFHGRSDDIIQKANMNIAPVEIENALMKHNEVALCVVFSVPNRKYNFVPAVCYTTKNNLEPEFNT